MHACVRGKLLQSCPTLCDHMGCSPSGPSVHRDSPGKNTRVGCHALLQGIFPSQGSNPGLQNCRQILYHLSYQGSASEWLNWTELNTVVKIANAKPCSEDGDVWFHQWATLSWKWLSLSLSPVMAPGLNSGFTDWYIESSADSFLQRLLRMGNRCAPTADSCQCIALKNPYNIVN